MGLSTACPEPLVATDTQSSSWLEGREGEKAESTASELASLTSYLARIRANELRWGLEETMSVSRFQMITLLLHLIQAKFNHPQYYCFSCPFKNHFLCPPIVLLFSRTQCLGIAHPTSPETFTFNSYLFPVPALHLALHQPDTQSCFSRRPLLLASESLPESATGPYTTPHPTVWAIKVTNSASHDQTISRCHSRGSRPGCLASLRYLVIEDLETVASMAHPTNSNR